MAGFSALSLLAGSGARAATGTAGGARPVAAEFIAMAAPATPAAQATTTVDSGMVVTDGDVLK